MEPATWSRAYQPNQRHYTSLSLAQQKKLHYTISGPTKDTTLHYLWPNQTHYTPLHYFWPNQTHTTLFLAQPAKTDTTPAQAQPKTLHFIISGPI